MVIYEEIRPTTEEIQELISLSKVWEKEEITFGLLANETEDITDKRVFVAREDGKIVGYIFEKDGVSKNYGSIMQDGETYFGIEEIYVMPEMRSQGVGLALMNYVKGKALEEGYHYIFLVTATKDWNKILDFYCNKCNMTFYCASLVEKI